VVDWNIEAENLNVFYEYYCRKHEVK